jgi:hypothetical protein
MDGRACFPVRKPWLTAEEPGDNHVFEFCNDFCFVHRSCDYSFVTDAGRAVVGLVVDLAAGDAVCRGPTRALAFFCLASLGGDARAFGAARVLVLPLTSL